MDVSISSGNSLKHGDEVALSSFSYGDLDDKLRAIVHPELVSGILYFNDSLTGIYLVPNSYSIHSPGSRQFYFDYAITKCISPRGIILVDWVRKLRVVMESDFNSFPNMLPGDLLKATVTLEV